MVLLQSSTLAKSSKTAKVIARWAGSRAISASAVGSRRLLSKLTHHSQKYGQIAPLLLL